MSTTTPGVTMPKPPPTTTLAGADRPAAAAAALTNMREARRILPTLTDRGAARRLRGHLGRYANTVLRYSDVQADRADAEAVLADLERARLERQVAEVLEVVRELVPPRMRDELGAELERRAVAELVRQRAADRSHTR